MSKATVQAGQTLLDIAIQYCGSSEALVSLAQLNGLSVTEILVAGSELTLPEVIDKRVVRVFTLGGYVPASDGATESITLPLPILRYTIRTTADNIAIVQPGQRLLDIAIQYLGSAEGVVSLAQLNGLSVTDGPPAGTVLKLPAVLDQSVVNYFKTGGYVPATDDAAVATPTGIGFMAIELDNIVG